MEIGKYINTWRKMHKYKIDTEIDIAFVTKALEIHISYHRHL